MNAAITVLAWLGAMSAAGSIIIYMTGARWWRFKDGERNVVGRLLISKDGLIALVLGYSAIRRTTSTPVPLPNNTAPILLTVYALVGVVEIITMIVYHWMLYKRR